MARPEVPVDVEDPAGPAVAAEEAGYLLDDPAPRRGDRERPVLDREADREGAAVAVGALGAAGRDAPPAEALDAGDLAVPVHRLEAERAAPVQRPGVGVTG